jgi:hypothetical protein
MTAKGGPFFLPDGIDSRTQPMYETGRVAPIGATHRASSEVYGAPSIPLERRP